MVALSMSTATARLWLKRLAESPNRSSQFRSSVVTTVPVRSRGFSASCSLVVSEKRTVPVDAAIESEL